MCIKSIEGEARRLEEQATQSAQNQFEQRSYGAASISSLAYPPPHSQRSQEGLRSRESLGVSQQESWRSFRLGWQGLSQPSTLAAV